MIGVFNRITKTGKFSSIRQMVTIGDHSAYKAMKETPAKKILYFTASWCPPVRLVQNGIKFDLCSIVLTVICSGMMLRPCVADL
jgi:hypothetical protein